MYNAFKFEVVVQTFSLRVFGVPMDSPKPRRIRGLDQSSGFYNQSIRFLREIMHAKKHTHTHKKKSQFLLKNVCRPKIRLRIDSAAFRTRNKFLLLKMGINPYGFLLQNKNPERFFSYHL